MKKRYQVFVSSTYEDLREERQEVIQALLELDCIPAGMELFPAADEDSWTLIKSVIAECDYYLIIVGGRYGSLSPRGKSYTEMEYEHAVALEIPIMAFLHEKPGEIPASKTEDSPEGKAALVQFRSTIESRRHCKFWNSPKDLGGVVSRAVANLIKTKPGIGWVRADLVPDESAAQEIVRLQHQIAELEGRIQENAVKPPKGTEDLAQGEEAVSLRFRFEAGGGVWRDVTHSFTWNELLALLGPIMIGGVNEADMKTKLVEAFRNLPRGIQIFSAYVIDEDFQRIKVQFRALGLIGEKTGPERKGTYWFLTPYGDTLMTQVAAIRSKAK